MAERPGVRLRLGSVRVRTTLVVVAVTVVTGLGCGWLLVAALGNRLADGIVLSAETRANEIAERLDDGTPVSALGLVGENDRFVHVLGPDERVLAASPNGPATPPAVPTDGETLTDVVARLPTEDDTERYVVASQTTDSGSGMLTVVVTQEASEIDDSQEALIGTLRLALPGAVLGIGLATWVLVGRALAPVEAIRSEVERITADRLGRRVPQPTSGDEVSDLARTMNQMLDRLEAARDRQRRLVSDASHELRSPATVIRQHAEVALAHPDSTSTEQLARVALAEGNRLEQLVEQMLWLARTDEDTSALRSQPVDLDDLVLEEAARVRAVHRRQVDTTRVSGGQVEGDALMLRRVIANLLDNAVGHATSTVSVAVFERDDEVVLRVDDDGPGIPAADRARVLERFVRLDTSRTRRGGGAGLGLAIVRGLVEMHHGHVLVDESAIGGARFDVVLPRLHGVQGPVSKASVPSTPRRPDDADDTTDQEA